MSVIGLIGGTGLTQLDALQVTRREVLNTPYGEPSSPLLFGSLEGLDLVFLPRHGGNHTYPPHQINYRANVWALKQVGAEQLVGIAAVGGITANMGPGVLCIADQIIDYTYGREHTFFEGDSASVTHIDFTEPYCQELRLRLLAAARLAAIPVAEKGTYGATQGPRLETAMEIQRLARDGCDIVGMTGMPEAALARELGLCYANLSLVVNWAAGLEEGPISMQAIEEQLVEGMHRALTLVSHMGA